MKEYVFEKVNKIPDMNSDIWKNIPAAKIDCVSFSPDAKNPKTEVRGVYSDAGITLFYETDESPVLARYSGVNEKPWTDSCVEFFFNPCPERDGKYFNFELSAAGGLLVGFGDGRKDRVRCDFSLDRFLIRTEISENGWKACFTVPFDFVLNYAKAFDREFAGNFQKCGDETENPHFTVWNEIISEKPDFHRPECFGRFILK